MSLLNSALLGHPKLLQGKLLLVDSQPQNIAVLGEGLWCRHEPSPSVPQSQGRLPTLGPSHRPGKRDTPVLSLQVRASTLPAQADPLITGQTPMTSNTQLSRFLQPCESCLSLSLPSGGGGRVPVRPSVLLPADRLRKRPGSGVDSQPEEVSEG